VLKLGNDNKTTANTWFSVMLAEEYILNYISLSSSVPDGTNKFQLYILTSTSVILLGFCVGLKGYRISAQHKALFVACNPLTAPKFKMARTKSTAKQADL